MTGRVGRSAGVVSATVLLALVLSACGSSSASDRTIAPAGGSTPSVGGTTDTDTDTDTGADTGTGTAGSTANSLDEDVAGSTGAVDGSARPGSDVAASTTVVTVPAASATTTTAKPAIATTTTAATGAAVTTTTAKPASTATTTTATTATTVANGSTDTLSEAEVAEIEQALDDLDALLDEIDTQLAGL